LSGLAQGSYSLTLTDNNGCSATAGPLALTQPSALSLSVTTVTPAGCGAGANQGTISISNSGGTAPYRYNWSNGATTQNLNGLTVGTYTLTLTDANGCNSSVSASVSSGGIAVSLVSADERVCFGASDGFINIAANPSAGASFSWSTGATTQNLSGLAAGTYTVTASNVSNGVTCTDVLAVTISQPANPLAISVNEVQGLDCSGQAIASAQGTASGGWNTTYTYLWNTGATSSTLGSLGAGSYSLTVTDAEGCVASGNISFTAPLVPQLNAWIGSTGQSSATVSLGSSIALDAGFNQAGVSYQWTPATDLSNANAASTSLTASTEGSATYIVQATAGNCVARDTVTVVVTANFRGIPTAFTPNGDGSNDRFRPIDLDGRFVKSFRVFNRWGQVVYDNAQISDGGWDGTFKGEDQPKDVYLYILEYQLPQDSQPTILRGEVTLVR
jgi:gliding motility-associated-like protein